MSPVPQPRLSADECIAELVLVPGPGTGLEETPGKAAPPSQEHGHRHGSSVPAHPGWPSGVRHQCSQPSPAGSAASAPTRNLTLAQCILLCITTLKSLLVRCCPSLQTLVGVGVGTAPCRQVFHWEPAILGNGRIKPQETERGGCTARGARRSPGL